MIVSKFKLANFEHHRTMSTPRSAMVLTLISGALIFPNLKSSAQCTLDVTLPATIASCDSCVILNPGVTGGTAPFAYQWSNGITTPTWQLCQMPGVYTVLVTDAMGCTDSATVSVTFIPQPVINVEIFPPTCPSSSDGTVIFHGGAPGSMYSFWAVSWFDSVFTGYPPGFYSYSVQNIYGCYSSGTVNLQAASCVCDTLMCKVVCERTVTQYSVPLNPGSTYQWIVSGAQSFTPNQNSVSVLWADDSLNNGTGLITCIENLLNGTQNTVSVCYNITPSPEALFQTQPSSSGNVLNVCAGAQVSFINQTSGATTYLWDFGNGQYSSLANPVYSFTQTGSYTVKLTATSECGCSVMDSLLVQVSYSAGPDIHCRSVVCANDTATYYTSVSCSNYNWSVTGGTILSSPPYGSAIVVLWGNGSQGNGVVTLDVGNCTGLCASPSSISVPIVSPSTAVAGKTKVCPGELADYTVPSVPGVTYTWSLTSGGYILSGQGTPSIQVQWGFQTGSYQVSVSYNFTLLGCTGSGTLPVDIKPPVGILQYPNLCFEYSPVNLVANLDFYSGTFYWTATDPQGTVSNYVSSSPLPLNFTTTGNYRITAAPTVANSSCNDTAYYSFRVYAASKPTSIAGETIICPGNVYEYTAVPTNAGSVFEWSVTGGVLSSTEGERVSVTWHATGPYILSVKNKMLVSPYCESDTIALQCSAYSLPGITGPATVCANSQYNYSVAGPAPPAVYYEWSVPSAAGSIISGQGSPVISVEWLNTSVIANITVTALHCGNQTVTLSNIQVLLPSPSVVTPAQPVFCSGTSVIAGSSPAASYTWYDSTGNVLGTNPVILISSEGHYLLETTDLNGCKARQSFFAQELPSPDAFLSTPDPHIFCLPFTVNATVYSNTAAGYSFQWFLNGNPAPGQTNSPIYFASLPGSYHAVVTNSSGCSATSNFISFQEINCVPNPCTTNETLDFNFSGCNPVQFTGWISSGNVTSPGWNFDDPASGANNTATGLNALHDFTKAGYYKVKFYGTVQNLTPPPPVCILFQEHVVDLTLKSDFKALPACAGSPTAFFDLSSWLPGNNITSWHWDFGDTQTSLLQNPVHNYSQPGTYTVTLTVANSVCSSSYSQQVVIPAVTASALFSPATVCVNTAVSFTDATIHPLMIKNWLWNFGDGTSSAAQHPEKSFSTAGNKNIQLTITDINGCSGSYSFSINVNPLPAQGVISPPGPLTICSNSSVNLMAPAGMSWNWADGSTLQNFTATSAGNYWVEVTTSNNCVYTTPPVAVSFSNSPVAAIIKGDTALCTGEQTMLLAYTGNFNSYAWFETGNPNALSGSIFLNINAVTPGIKNYYLVVTNSSGCSDTSELFKVTIHPVPAIPVLTSVPAGNNCAGSPVSIEVLNPQHQTSYNWSNGMASYYLSGSSTPAIQTGISGNYFVTAVNAGGCSRSSSVLSIHPMPDFSSVITGCYELCQGTPVVIHGPAGYSLYQWIQMINGNWVVFSTSQNLSITTQGIYKLVLTTNQGCRDTSEIISITLQHCCNMQVTVQGSILNCYGMNNGSASVISPSGAGISYLWSTGQTTQSISNLGQGTYFVSVSSAPTCQSQSLVSVLSPAPMPVPIIFSSGDTLFSSVNGSAFYYQWFNYGQLIPGATGALYINPDSGCYTVMITDNNGCTATSSVFCITTGVPTLTPAFGQGSIHPNPFNGNELIVFLPEIRHGNTEVDVFGCMGQKMLSISVPVNSNRFSITSNRLKEFLPGLYLVKVRMQTEIFYFKVIKN